MNTNYFPYQLPQQISTFYYKSIYKLTKQKKISPIFNPISPQTPKPSNNINGIAAPTTKAKHKENIKPTIINNIDNIWYQT